MHPAKAFGRLHTFASPHGARPLLDSSMVLFQVIVQVTVGAMTHGFPQLSFDGSRIGVMPVGRHALRDTTGDSPCGVEERFCRCLVPLLTQHYIDQVPRAIYCAVEIGPA